MKVDKYGYLREARAQPAGNHHCHWPGCPKRVPPAIWGCRDHWYTLPPHLRRKILTAYRPGQEITKRPSAEYLEAAQEVQLWIRDHINRPPAQPKLI